MRSEKSAAEPGIRLTRRYGQAGRLSAMDTIIDVETAVKAEAHAMARWTQSRTEADFQAWLEAAATLCAAEVIRPGCADAYTRSRPAASRRSLWRRPDHPGRS